MSGQPAVPPRPAPDGSPRAVVVDELALARAGLGAVLAGLGIEVVGETRSAREALSIAMIDRPDLVVVGAPADLTFVDSVRRLLQLRPHPIVVTLLPPGTEADVRYLVALGVGGAARRGAATSDVAATISRAMSGEQFVDPALHGALARGPEPLNLAAEDESAVVLSSREREVLALLAAGRTNPQIAAELSISLATVKSHLVRMYSKLEASNRNEALGRAVSLGLVR